MTTIDPDSDRELLTIAKPIPQKRKSVIKEIPVGKKAEKGDEFRRKRMLARNDIEKGIVNENESGIIKTKDDSERRKGRVITIEDDSERDYNKIKEECDDSDSSVELLSQVSNELSLLNSKKRTKQKKEEDKD
ncbi:uncharacterized protein Bfra_002270 [Botrytis fragariae]|uniref:Uncharacterized protein n=1 Tax=Botrytis fragariae TaxID=1964551 RepID=A0A8H6AY25_9HELO|nr:uncharacterized protein Bfra_002270 [Botrytis fragariae]KAF5875874.1 hypothetical protein Bfra_002270 [Botrytis fragariae]